MSEGKNPDDGDSIRWRGVEYVPAKVAAAELGYEHRSFLNLLEAGKLPDAKKWGRFWYVRRDRIDEAPRPQWKKTAATDRELVESLLLSDVPPKAVHRKTGVPLSTVYSIRKKLFKRIAEEIKMLQENYNATTPRRYRGTEDAETVSFFLFRSVIQGVDPGDINPDYLPNLVETKAYVDINRNMIYVPRQSIKEMSEKYVDEGRGLGDGIYESDPQRW